MPFDLRRITAETFVEGIDYQPTVASTNDLALESCHSANHEGPFLFLASEQTRGRGRGSNQWWSTAGALTFSLVLQPESLGIRSDLWPQASLTTGLSVCMALENVLPDKLLALKWPNDGFLNSRKVCGILVEVGRGVSPLLVIGIGVNVNNGFAAAPPELAMVATSLSDETGRAFDLTEILIGLLKQIETQFRRLATADPQLPADWQRRCALRGLTVTIDTQGDCQTGRCTGIDSDGALVLDTEHGLQRFFGGVVTHFG